MIEKIHKKLKYSGTGVNGGLMLTISSSQCSSFINAVDKVLQPWVITHQSSQRTPIIFTASSGISRSRRSVAQAAKLRIIAR